MIRVLLKTITCGFLVHVNGCNKTCKIGECFGKKKYAFEKNLSAILVLAYEDDILNSTETLVAWKTWVLWPQLLKRS